MGILAWLSKGYACRLSGKALGIEDVPACHQQTELPLREIHEKQSEAAKSKSVSTVPTSVPSLPELQESREAALRRLVPHLCVPSAPAGYRFHETARRGKS